MSPVAVITGGSSGIGRAACEAFAKEGWRVYELSRSGRDREGIVHIGADLSDEESVKAAFSLVAQREGKIDLLINNAGYGISGAAELTDISTVKQMMDVDFYGVLRCVKHCVPIMRHSGGGRIINMSSVAAVMPIPFQSFYSCAKSAVNSLTFTLANELKPFNISVCALMPGDVKTGFTDARQKQTGDVYKGAIERSVAVMEHDERSGMSPEYIASCLLKMAKKKKVSPLYTGGSKYRVFVFLKRLLPDRLVNYILGKMYA